MRYLVENRLVRQSEAMKIAGNVAQNYPHQVLAGNDGYPWEIFLPARATSLTVAVNEAIRIHPFVVAVRIYPSERKMVFDCYDAPPPLDLQSWEQIKIFCKKLGAEALAYRKMQYEVLRRGRIPADIDEETKERLLASLSYYRQIGK